ncbi:uncharacterized protein LOC125661399 isoform X2 [Ostrea edulis]|uniref:uncharacterized protein LOC125661399 isoform X2 n=1 Tax=Ostrea edulis TaxID=37623 RepID=UPI0024AEF6F9|nr:uncharacterized protein LOC125661399 isoform X2 [Ostrea edulis]
MNKYKNVLIGEAASGWKQLIGRFHWLDDNEIAMHLIDVHEQHCKGSCPLERMSRAGETRADQYTGQPSMSRAGDTDVTKHKEEQADLSLDLEVDEGAESVDEGAESVDEGAESVDDDSSGESDHLMISDEEVDVKLVPEFMDYIPQNSGSTCLREDDFLLPSTNKSTDPGGDNLLDTLTTVKQEPVGGNSGSTVIQNVACVRHTEADSSAVKTEPGLSVEEQYPHPLSGIQNSLETSSFSMGITWPLLNTEKFHQKILNSAKTENELLLSSSGPVLRLKTPHTTNSLESSEIFYNAQDMCGVPIVSSQSGRTTQNISFLKAIPSDNYLTSPPHSLTPRTGSVGSQTLRTATPSGGLSQSSLSQTLRTATPSGGLSQSSLSQALRTATPSGGLSQSSLSRALRTATPSGGLSQSSLSPTLRTVTPSVGLSQSSLSHTLRTAKPSGGLSQSSLPLTLILKRATGGLFMIRPPTPNNNEPSFSARQPHILNTKTLSDSLLSLPAPYLPQFNLTCSSGGDVPPQQSSSDTAVSRTLNSGGQPLLSTPTERMIIPKETDEKENLQYGRSSSNGRETKKRPFPYSEEAGCYQFDLSTEIEEEISKLARKETLDSNKFRSKLTHKKTAGDIRLLYVYLHSIGEHQKIHKIPPRELDFHLHKFFNCVRKGNGEEYEPFSLRAMADSFERYLKSYNYGYSIFQSKEFTWTKEVLQDRMKQLVENGKGNFNQRSHTLTATDVDKLFESGQLGNRNPACLLRTMWFINTVYLGIKGSKEHHQLKWGDIKLCCDKKDNLEFLEYRRRETAAGCVKSRQGHVRVVFANTMDVSRCPVAHYKLYRDLRPPGYSNPGDPYYLVSTSGVVPERCFRTQSVGVNKLNKFMSVMAKNAGLINENQKGRRFTNFSAVKYHVLKEKISVLAETEREPFCQVRISTKPNTAPL